jgi:hypothetical protein
VGKYASFVVSNSCASLGSHFWLHLIFPPDDHVSYVLFKPEPNQYLSLLSNTSRRNHFKKKYQCAKRRQSTDPYLQRQQTMSHTISTNYAFYQFSRDCRDLNLLDSHQHTSLDSLDYSTDESSRSSLRNLMPWDDVNVPSRKVTSASRCTSPLCPACRRGAVPPTTFVTVNTANHSPRLPPPPPRLAPRRWWERSSSFTSTLAEHLGEWVEAHLMACKTSLSNGEDIGDANDHSGCWHGSTTDCGSGVPTAPYDEASSF